MKLKYNLQFFGENDDDYKDVLDGNGNPDSNDDTTTEDKVDTEAFAELISVKDKKIEELEGTIKQLKKANAELTIKVSAGQKVEKTFEENLLGLVGQPARKE